MSSLPPNPYKVLGIEKTTDKAEIQIAYKKLVLKHHPDKVQDPAQKAERQEQFERIQRAYEFLDDDVQLTKYREQVKLMELRNQMAMASRLPRNHHNKNRTPEPSPGRRTKTEKDRDRDEWIVFALKLFDEAGKGKKPAGPDPGLASADMQETVPDSIEQEIRQRNQAFKDLRQGVYQDAGPAEGVAQPSGSASTEEPQAAKGKLYAGPPEQLNLEVMNHTSFVLAMTPSG